MNFELYFAKKVIQGGKNSFSKPIIRISILAISLGIAMMTLSLAIVEGFQQEIKRKVVGFGSHIQITDYQSKGSMESQAISKNRDFYPFLDTIPGINHIQVFALKGAILQANETNNGVIIKGIGSDFNWDFFDEYIKEGERLNISDSTDHPEILISEAISKTLNVKLGEDLLVYFAQQPARLRKLEITGIYNTGLGEMDERMVFMDIAHLQKINSWDENQVGGFEILIDDLDDLDALTETVYQQIDYDLSAQSIKDSRLDIFNWLELQDVNVIIIITLLLLVCGIDMISALLILILERTKMIGVLKALGAKNTSIRKIFLYNAAYLILAGLVIGNLLGLGVAIAQQELGFLKLPQEAYFIDTVPIKLNFSKLLLLNLGTLVVCLLMLLIPSNIVASIKPVKTLRFD
ncbi:MAG: FtsX-like permease family protein [Vicingaceae bacterium]